MSFVGRCWRWTIGWLWLIVEANLRSRGAIYKVLDAFLERGSDGLEGGSEGLEGWCQVLKGPEALEKGPDTSGKR